MDTTLLKGLRVLETLARSPVPRGITDLATELGVPKSNAHRSVQTLMHAGLVRQDRDTGRYETTLKLFELGNLCVQKLDVRSVAQTEMRRLADLSQETIHLSILDGGEVIYIDKIESPQPVRAYSQVGGRAPAHCVASGKAQLAFVPSALAQLPDPLPVYTANSARSRADLARELAQVAQSGLAENRGEWREAVGGIASPIFDFSGQCVAAIGVSGPNERLDTATRRKFAEEVLSSAETATRLLGGNLQQRLKHQSLRQEWQ